MRAEKSIDVFQTLSFVFTFSNCSNVQIFGTSKSECDECNEFFTGVDRLFNSTDVENGISVEKIVVRN
ncbi:hypothetical protein KIN20_019249 [Parelaphostrongylus tenuis]|uniref:Uncharacterized protein n=1 Tax=Parelaphostrongylus tenuis TaxID=148309 RepID=A0AAD5N8H4_PARTN|nr:hypothetical protein KIN20_019249 [Parelaphostrongylus tenuis]